MLSPQDVVAKFQLAHGSRYDYSDFVYRGTRTLGTVICPDHGCFEVTPINHWRGSRCPLCAESFKDKCSRLGVDYYRALKRRQAGLSDSSVFDKEFIRSNRAVGLITVFGREYPNLKAAVRDLKPPAPRETIGRWLRDGMSAEEAFQRIPNPGVANGLIYLVTNIANGKQYVGLTVQTIARRWRYHQQQAAAGSISSASSLHAALREYGAESFQIELLDSGISKRDLEAKERHWIKKLSTAIPHGYNLTTGGESGGSNKQPKTVDGVRFAGAREAAEHIASTRSIGFEAAKARLRKGRVDAKTPSLPGHAITKTSAYIAWSRIKHGLLNPKSKFYVPGIEIDVDWENFPVFLAANGQPPETGMCFARIDKKAGFFKSNCRWMTKSEASRINADYMKQEGLLVGRRGRSKAT